MKQCAILFILVNIFINMNANPITIEVNEGWKFKQQRLTNWYPATVPGVVHTDLLNNKIIEEIGRASCRERV